MNSSEIFFGLTYAQTQQLAFNFAVARKIEQIPESWKKHNQAGVDWMRGFMRRHSTLSLRKPENVSIARALSFSKNNVKEFYDNLERVYAQYKFPPERILSLDETGLNTVVQSPPVIAQKGKKQVGNLVSSERGETVTMVAIINAGGNALPPVYVIPRKKFDES